MAADFPIGLPILTDKSFSETINESLISSLDKMHSPINSSPTNASHDQPGSSGNARDGDISVFNPRRFTPTLHASLVSEILSVRRDLDLKAQFIEELETNLQVAKSENEALFGQLNRSSKENRTVKRQLEHLERDSSAALEGLTKERDSAKENDNGMKYKIEMLRRKIRAQEEDAGQMQEILEKGKSSWDAERRQLERRLHTSETRLKVILKDLAAHHASGMANEAGWFNDNNETTKDPLSGTNCESNRLQFPSGKGSPRKAQEHVRNQSNDSGRKSVRLSAPSISESEGMTWLNGQSLADELSFGEEDVDSQDAVDSNDDLTEQELRSRRGLDSRQSYYQDEKAKRVLGLAPSHGNHVSNRLDLGDPLLEQDEGSWSERIPDNGLNASLRRSIAHPKSSYKDLGPQCSPNLLPQFVEAAALNAKEVEMPLLNVGFDGQQRQKNAASLASEGQEVTVPSVSAVSMVSSTSQTIDLPVSRAATQSANERPKISIDGKATSLNISASTQTDYAASAQLTNMSRVPAPPLPIPTITIDPPLSAPPSPKDAILPPGTKNVACQINFGTQVLTASVSVQTEEIRVDQRSVNSRPIPLTSANGAKLSRLVREQSSQIPFPSGQASKAAHRGSHEEDNLSFSKTKSKSTRSTGAHDLSRWRNKSSDGSRFTEPKEVGDSKDPSTAGTVVTNLSPVSGQYEETAEAKENMPSKAIPWHTVNLTSSSNKSRVGAKPLRFTSEAQIPASIKTTDNSNLPVLRNITNLPLRSPQSSDRSIRAENRFKNFDNKQKSVWRSTLIQSGTAAHINNHSKSPSIGSGGSSTTGGYGATPPFPVPTRSSSMGITHCDSDGPYTPTPNHNGSPKTQRQSGRRHASRVTNIRKVRSAAAIPREKRPRELQSRLSPQSSNRASTETPQSPATTRNKATPPALLQPNVIRNRLHRSDTTSQGSGTYVEGPTQPSVIDAIAATMVGEWMWKYVRKRKSFGMVESGQEHAKGESDGPGNVAGNGVRHKRWVWLSPYDKTVMWSSKQPTTEAALMGKPSRTCKRNVWARFVLNYAKLFLVNIHSVLDVKDDTPMNRGATSHAVYDRSILILTPQRALKFTALSADRHYLWLKALSFLVHSSLDQPTVPLLPTMSLQDDDNTAHHNSSSFRRTSIKGSLRFGKDSAHRDLSAQVKDSGASIYLGRGLDEHVSDAASPPNVPRFYHGRVRSNTGSRLSRPSINSRAFSPSQQMSPTQPVFQYVDLSAVPQKSLALNAVDATTESSHHAAVSKGSTFAHNFFEAMPTYRMEAFVEPRLSGDSFQALPGLDRPGLLEHKGCLPVDKVQNMFLSENTPEVASLFRGF